jgi:hypothetical protein
LRRRSVIHPDGGDGPITESRVERLIDVGDRRWRSTVGDHGNFPRCDGDVSGDGATQGGDSGLMGDSGFNLLAECGSPAHQGEGCGQGASPLEIPHDQPTPSCRWCGRVSIARPIEKPSSRIMPRGMHPWTRLGNSARGRGRRGMGGIRWRRSHVLVVVEFVRGRGIRRRRRCGRLRSLGCLGHPRPVLNGEVLAMAPSRLPGAGVWVNL